MSQQLLLTDLHLHLWPEYSEYVPGVGHSRLLDGLSILDQASTVMTQRKIKDGLFLGDINHLHDKMLYPVMTALEAWMQQEVRRGHSWTFLCGNHDRDTTDGRSHCLSGFRGLVRVVDEPTTFELENVRFHAIPWLWNADTFTDYWKDIRDTDVVLLHHDLADVPYRGRLIGRSGSARICQAFTLSGHYHDRIQVHPRLLYCGAPMHHDWGDVGKRRGMHVLSHQRGEHHVEFIPTKYPRFVTVTDRFARKAPVELLLRKCQGNFIRMMSTGGSPEDARNRVQECSPRALEVIDPQTRPEVLVLEGEQTSIFDFETVVREFVKQAAPSSLSPKKLIKLGLQAIREVT